MVMLDFIYMGSTDLLGTGRVRKIKMKIYVSRGNRTHIRTPIPKEKFENLWTTQKRLQKLRYHNECGPKGTEKFYYVTIAVPIRVVASLTIFILFCVSLSLGSKYGIIITFFRVGCSLCFESAASSTIQEII